MKAVSETQLQQVIDLMKRSINTFRTNDSDLINLPSESEVIENYLDKEKHGRKLHEVCINHRLTWKNRPILLISSTTVTTIM